MSAGAGTGVVRVDHKKPSAGAVRVRVKNDGSLCSLQIATVVKDMNMNKVVDKFSFIQVFQSGKHIKPYTTFPICPKCDLSTHFTTFPIKSIVKV